MPNWVDYTPDLDQQAFCARLCCWPCQCGVALTNAVINCDVSGCWKVICCCPVSRNVYYGDYIFYLVLTRSESGPLIRTLLLPFFLSLFFFFSVVRAVGGFQQRLS